jgi:hypothetical protein
VFFRVLPGNKPLRQQYFRKEHLVYPEFTIDAVLPISIRLTGLPLDTAPHL